MCGIAGILSLAPDRPIEAGELATLAEPLAHRGPDDEGRYVDPQRRCGLAFRRLAIIDLAGGRQPLANEDETAWVVFNGEIYNFPALRRELEARGHRFRTHSDTETIVHLYEEHGAGCLERLHGMFALALWDARRGTLLLARDRFGKKPLTYVTHAGRLYFASEAKALLALPGLPRELDPRSLHRYLLFQYVPAPHSIFRGFRQLPPGYRVTWTAGRPAAAAPEPYYRLAPAPFRGTYADARAQLGPLLTAAVEKRLIADVPLGAFLSGGIDSSIVVGLMRRLGVAPLRTFTIGFPDARYDETAYARQVARHFASEHHEHIVTPAAREVLDTLAYHFDEPLADSSAIPTYYVSRYTRQSVTVALTGDGGDEAFGGYDRYRAARIAARADALPRFLRALLAGAAGLLPHHRPRTWTNRAYRFLRGLAGTPAERYRAWVQIFAPETLAALYRPAVAAALAPREPLDWFAELYDGAPGNAAERAARADYASYLPYDLLTKVDRASMACSLECRCPFLDHVLVEFALSLPTAWRVDARGGKRILKDWARDLLPPDVLTRGKMGFGVPVGAWFRGELADLLRGTVLAPDGLCARMFDAARLRAFTEAHISGRSNHEHPLWSLLMLERWFRRWRPTTPWD